MPATPAQTDAQADALRRLARVHGNLTAWRVCPGEPTGRIAVEFANGRACVLLPCGLSDGLLPNGSLSALSEVARLAVEVESIEWRLFDADSGEVIAEPDSEADATETLAKWQTQCPDGRFEIHRRKVGAWEVAR